MGSLLVQSDSKTGEPLLFHVKLPDCIRKRHRAVNTWVFLLDAQARTYSLQPYDPPPPLTGGKL
jgi:uridine kinase